MAKSRKRSPSERLLQKRLTSAPPKPAESLAEPEEAPVSAEPIALQARMVIPEAPSETEEPVAEAPDAPDALDPIEAEPHPAPVPEEPSPPPRAHSGIDEARVSRLRDEDEAELAELEASLGVFTGGAERPARLRRGLTALAAILGVGLGVVLGIKIMHRAPAAKPVPTATTAAATADVAAPPVPAPAPPPPPAEPATAAPSASASAAPVASAAPAESASAAPVASAAPSASAIASSEPAPSPTSAPAAPASDDKIASARAMRDQALDLLKKSKNPEAMAKASDALEADPTDAMPYLVLGSALQDAGRWKEAHAAYALCVKNATKGMVDECRAMMRTR